MTDTGNRLRRPRSLRAFAAWLGVWLLLVQTAFAGGWTARAIAPADQAGDRVVVCSVHGLMHVHADGTPVDRSSDRSAPCCPCCLPFAPGHGGAILALGVAVPLPIWRKARPASVFVIASAPRDAYRNPQQPRAPPRSV